MVGSACEIKLPRVGPRVAPMLIAIGVGICYSVGLAQPGPPGDATSFDPRLSDELWSGTGVAPHNSTGIVRRLHFDPDGVLHIAGNERNFGGVYANGVARWNGESWEALGSSSVVPNTVDAGTNITVNALAFDDSGGVFAAGTFPSIGVPLVDASNVAYFDGSSWNALGDGLNGAVYDLARQSNGDLLAVGLFTGSGSITINGIARWNGAQWAPPSAGAGQTLTGTVSSIAVRGDGTYVISGSFTIAGESPITNLAEWRGGAFHALPLASSPFIGEARQLIAGPDGEIYFLSDPTNATGAGFGASGIGVYRDGTFSLFSITGVSEPIRTVSFARDGRRFAVVDHPSLARIGRVIEWNSAGQFVAEYPMAQPLNYNNQFVGTFPEYSFAHNSPSDPVLYHWLRPSGIISNDPKNLVSTLSNGVMELLEGGITGRASNMFRVIELENGNIAAAGRALSLVDVPSSGVSVFDGANWTTLSPSAPQTNDRISNITALAEFQGDIYIAGPALILAPGDTSRLARWNGSTFEGIDPFLQGVPTGLTAGADGALYLTMNRDGGSNIEIPVVYRSTNGTNWTPVGQGQLSGDVRAILVESDGSILAAGSLAVAGTPGTQQFAGWNGSEWLALPSSALNAPGTLVQTTDGTYYAAAYDSFSTNQNIAARWNGEEWETLPNLPGFRITTDALAADAENNIYVAGIIVSSQSTSSAYPIIARWDGVQWSAFGSGIINPDPNTSSRFSGIVSALTFDANGDLWVGGQFSIAGDKPSSHVAKYRVSAITEGALSVRGDLGGDYQWRRVGTETWLSPGQGEYAIAPGNYQVEFQALGGGSIQSPVSALISRNRTTIIDFDAPPEPPSAWVVH